MSGVRVVCRGELAPGFALAGLRVTDAPTPEEAAARAVALADEPDVGVILIEEACWRAIPEPARRALERRAVPMLVPFPGPAPRDALEGPESHLVEILRQAIGYRVRLT